MLPRPRRVSSAVARMLVVLAATGACGACGAGSAARKPRALTPATCTAPDAKPSPQPAAFDIDPVEIGLGRTTGGASGAAAARTGIERVCDESLARALAVLAEIRALDGAPTSALTWNNTLGKLDQATLALRNASSFPALMAVAHPDEQVREKAKACEPKSEKVETALWLDRPIARAVQRYAGKREPLPPTRQRLLDRTLREFHRNGLDLDANGQARLRTINERVTALGLAFDENLAGSAASLDATPAQLQGLPREWIASHPPRSDGKVEITTDYPDYFPILQYARDRRFALELFKRFENRAADKNVAVIEELLVLRREKAKLLGYATWADYVLEPRMAKDAKTVAAFVERLRTHIAKKAESELAEFRAAHVKLGGKATDPIPPSDRLYLEDHVRKAKYGLDSKEVSKYFEVRRVKDGLLAITSKLFGVRYKRAEDAPTWHADVEAIDVEDDAGRPLGRFYFDLYPRDGKYKHAAVFGIRDTARMADGSRLLPMAAIECNFPKPGGAGPALMNHQDAITFFHEFGHVLHHLLSEAELSTFAGTSVARDFVEAPSQMLEEWAWNRDTLALFARHHDTNAALPAGLHAAMLRSRSFGRALATQRQLYLAALDQAYHTRPPPLDTTQVLAEINDAYTPFKYVEGTHFQASFGHLIGYDAAYYGYQWAAAIAQDLFTRFKRDGLLDGKTAAQYRAAILAPGDSADANELIARFLGRAGSDEAYHAFLVE